jgi:hypothetical protein
MEVAAALALKRVPHPPLPTLIPWAHKLNTLPLSLLCTPTT